MDSSDAVPSPPRKVMRLLDSRSTASTASGDISFEYPRRSPPALGVSPTGIRPTVTQGVAGQYDFGSPNVLNGRSLLTRDDPAPRLPRLKPVERLDDDDPHLALLGLLWPNSRRQSV